MRKYAAILCTVAMLCGLCACKKADKPADTKPTATTTATTTTTTTVAVGVKAPLNLTYTSPFSDGVALVRRGEERYIFPFQENADAMFNSALTYELAIMKKYAYPALLGVQPESPNYTLARRLVKFLNYIETADVEDEIPVNSILREFIGGCCFYREQD